MRNGRSAAGVGVLALLLAGAWAGGAEQDPAVDRAKQVLQMLAAQRFEEIAKRFDSQMAAALPSAQLANVWSTLVRQTGAFKAVIDQRVETPRPGLTAVVLGCQFEKTALNVIVAFDSEDRIAGLRFVPRPQGSEQEAAPPPSSRFKEEPVTVGTEWALPGTLSMPDGPVAAAVVLVHGSGPGDRDETVGPNKPFRDLAWGLADRGIAVLRYVKRTRRYAAKLAGDQTFTVQQETIEDAVLGVRLLQGHARIDPKRVFVLGHSLGGMLAPRIAAEDRSIAGLIIMAGATRPILDAARDQLAYLASLSPTQTPIDSGEALASLRRAAPDAYWKDLDAYHPAQAAAALTLPILILQGERDYQVTQVDLDGWRRALGGRSNVTIRSYPTLNHLFMPGEGKSTPAEYERPGHIPLFVLDDIADWIKAHAAT